jgi:flagellar hook-length control protein FliK
MTVPTLTSAPLPAAPGAAPTGSGASSNGDAPGQGFGVVMSALLGRAGTHPEAAGSPAPPCCDDAGGVASAVPAGSAVAGAVPQDGGTGEPAEDAGQTAGDVGQATSLVQPPTGTPVAAVLTPAVPDAAGRAVDTPVPAAALATDGADTTSAAGPAGPASAGLSQPPTAEPGQGVGGPSTDTAHTANGAPAARGDAAESTTGTAPTTGLTAVAGASQAGAASTPTATAHADPASPVAGQVFPEVTRLVTRGDGTQRLTLRLSPDNLGEVRIVVTVRDGAVDVSLAAGAEAQEALRHGSPELRRLLESVGAVSTQIAVRDLPTATTSAGQPAGTGAAHLDASGTGGQSRHDRAGEQHHAKTPAGNDAAGPSATRSRVPTDQTPATGVDLRL